MCSRPTATSVRVIVGHRDRMAAWTWLISISRGAGQRKATLTPGPSRAGGTSSADDGPGCRKGGGRAASERAGLMEHLGGRPVAQRPARTRVRAVLHRPHLRVADRPQVRPLRQVLPDQPVRVPGRLPLPGVLGVAKKNPAFSASATPAWPANSLPLSAVTVWTATADGSSIAGIAAETSAEVRRSTLCRYVYSGALSTRETTAPLWPFPMIVSASQSPTRSFLSTSAGRPEMSTRPGMRPRPECRPPRQFGFCRAASAAGTARRPPSCRPSGARISTAGPPPSRPRTQPSRYPLRAPALGQKPLDTRPALRRHPPGDPGRPAAAHLRLPPPLAGAVARIPAVPAQLPPDRRAVTAQTGRDRPVRQPAFLQRADPASIPMGQVALALGHGCLPILNKGTVAASWPIRNIMRQENRSTPPLVLHFGLEWGKRIHAGFAEPRFSR